MIKEGWKEEINNANKKEIKEIKENKRKSVLEEIIKTEKTYVNNLNTLVDV